MDDLVLCYQNSKDGKWVPLYARSVDNSMWSPLLEKALAQQRGGYSNIEGGLGDKAFKFLNDYPTISLTRGKQNTIIWSYDHNHGLVPHHTGNAPLMRSAEVEKSLRMFAQLGYFVSAGCSQENRAIGQCVSKDTSEQAKIMPNHEYSVLGYADLIAENGDITTLVKLRNPHGFDDCSSSGQWGRNSERCLNFQKELKFDVTIDDGVWWMSMSQFLTTFDRIHVSCRINAASCPIQSISARPGP